MIRERSLYVFCIIHTMSRISFSCVCIVSSSDVNSCFVYVLKQCEVLSTCTDVGQCIIVRHSFRPLDGPPGLPIQPRAIYDVGAPVRGEGKVWESGRSKDNMNETRALTRDHISKPHLL